MKISEFSSVSVPRDGSWRTEGSTRRGDPQSSTRKDERKAACGIAATTWYKHLDASEFSKRKTHARQPSSYTFQVYIARSAIAIISFSSPNTINICVHLFFFF